MNRFIMYAAIIAAFGVSEVRVSASANGFNRVSSFRFQMLAVSANQMDQVTLLHNFVKKLTGQ